MVVLVMRWGVALSASGCAWWWRWWWNFFCDFCGVGDYFYSAYWVYFYYL